LKTKRKITRRDILVWASEAKLDLPDHWESIRQNLPHQQAETADNNSILTGKPLLSSKRILVAAACLAVLALLGGLLLSGQFEQWSWFKQNPGDNITPATGDSTGTTASGATKTTASTHSDEQQAFSDQANAQFALMEQAHIPDQYPFYAGCFIEDLSVFVIHVTCEPDVFITEFADLLDFSIIEVRQVKYTLKELESAYAPLYQEFSGSDRLANIGVVGMAVFEQDNAIRIVVKAVNNKVRQAVADLVPDPGMIVFEVGGELVP
jgi:hypothetical protein